MKKRSYMHMYISIWTLLSPRPRRRQLAPPWHPATPSYPLFCAS
jgi:hypothetical protein